VYVFLKVADLEKLASLHLKGLLDSSEFKRMKSSVIGNALSHSALKQAKMATPSPTISLTAAELGAAHTSKTRPIISKIHKTVLARQGRNEKRCGEVAKTKMATGSEDSDIYLAAYISSAPGKAEFPATSACIKNDKHLQLLAINVGHFIASVGSHNARIVIRFLTEGLPVSFLKDDLGMTPRDLQLRRTNKNVWEDPYNHSLCQKQYADGVQRSKITTVEQQLLVEFFNSSTAVFSGSDRRCLEYMQHDWECKVTHTHLAITINPQSQSSLWQGRWYT
jgi:hypothetical protein